MKPAAFLWSALMASAVLMEAIAAPPTIVETHAAAPGVLVVTLETSGNENGNGTAPDVLNTTPANWKINGASPTAVYRESLPWDEGPLVSGFYRVTVRHFMSLMLPTALQDGATYQITTPYGSTSLAFNQRSTWCSSLHVNETGYASGTTVRYANYGAWMGDGGSLAFSASLAYQVIDSSGAVVFSGTSSSGRDDTAIGGPTSGEWTYRLSLSALQPGGPYRVVVPGCGVSRPFGVGDTYTLKAFEILMRGFYFQRCGQEIIDPYAGGFTRGACHTQMADTRVVLDAGLSKPGPYGISVPAGTPTVRSPRFGWHDAGNYQRRPEHITIPIQWLGVYEAWKDHFKDNQYSIPIPEGRDGIPDFLNEILQGVGEWEALQIDDPADAMYGAIRAGTQEAYQPQYGVDNAASMSQVIGTFAPTEYTTVLGAGLFAQASRAIRQFDPAHADVLVARARRAWANAASSHSPPPIATKYMYAAGQLYFATGDQAFHAIFKTIATAIIVNNSAAWNEQYLAQNVSAACQEYHFSSYILPVTPQSVDPALVATLRSKILGFAANGGYMAPAPEESPYAQGATRFYGWGGLSAQGRYSRLYAYASLFVTDPAVKQRYINYVSEYADYGLGVNPMGMSLYTGLGVDQPNSPLHLDSWFTRQRGLGNIPGILIYHAADGRSQIPYQLAVSGKMFPAFESRPILRRYAHGWSLIAQNEFTIHETMAPAAEMFAFLLPSLSAPPPPAPDAGTSPDASVPPPDSSVALVCVQPVSPVCGPLAPSPDAGVPMSRTIRRVVH